MNTITDLLCMSLMADSVTVPFSVDTDSHQIISRIALAFLANKNACDFSTDDEHFWSELFFSYKNIEMEFKLNNRNPYANFSFESDHDQNIIKLVVDIYHDDSVYSYTLDRASFLKFLSLGNIVSPYSIDEEQEFLDFITKNDNTTVNYALYMRNYNLKATQNGMTLQCYGIKS